MSKNMTDITRRPINKTAARVVSKGVEWVPNKIILTADSVTPLALAKVADLSRTEQALLAKDYGLRRGRLTIIGRSAEKGGAAYVVRCDCGNYTRRSRKAMRNENNKCDCCETCRHLIHLKREEAFRRTGKDQNTEDFF